MKKLLHIFLLFSLTGWAGTPPGADSLLKVAASSDDTSKVKILLKVAALYNDADPKNALQYFSQAAEAARKSRNGKWIVKAQFSLFNALRDQGQTRRAYRVIDSTLLYIDTLKSNADWCSYLIQRGNVSYGEGNFNNAAFNYLKALRMADDLNDNASRARAYHGLGFANHAMNNLDKAIGYYTKARDLYTSTGNYSSAATINANIGGIYVSMFEKSKDQKDFRMAFDYLTQALNASITAKNNQLIGNNYNNLASLFAFNEDYKEAIVYNKKAYEIRESSGLKFGLVSSAGNLARCYLLLNDIPKAEEYSKKTLEIAQDIHSARSISEAYSIMSDIAAKKGDEKTAFGYFKRYIHIRDSVQDTEQSKKQAELEEKYSSEKKDKEIELLNQTQQAKDAELARQKVVNYAIGFGLALVVLFSFFMLRAYREKRKANDELSVKNAIIEEKNKSITDSINYARTIQTAIIPGADEFEQFFSGSFVCYLPKDIVSGDFYWLASQGDKVFFAAADCTGHGVPGGFMCMLGSSLLSEIVNDRKIHSPAGILDELRDKIMSSLRQKGQTGESKDGMDITLCCLERSTMKLTYSSAYNSFYRIRNNELFESEVNKMPVGYHHKMEGFRQFELQLQKGDILYLFTDGYADQFGGKDKKKFKYSRLKELLLNINTLPLKDQKAVLEQNLTDWKGDLEQVDDVLIIGVKI